MKKVFKKILLLVLLVCIIAVYLNLTNIIVTLPVFKTTGMLIETSINNNNLLTEYYNFEASRQTDNLIKTVELSGWAFLATEKENSQKTIKIILKDIKNEKTYEVKTDVYPRPDVYNAYSEKVNLMGNSHGFKAFFSPLQLPDGLYHMLLYVQENTSTSGLIFTEQYFIKKDYLFKLYQPSDSPEKSDQPSQQKEVNIANNANSSDKVEYYIDQAMTNNGYLDIMGWALIEGQNTSNIPVFLSVENNEKSTIYSTIKTWRADVGFKYKSELYTQSGFRAKVPIDGSSGETTITVIVGQNKADTSYTLSLG
jgi:hypothetical protein